MGPRLRRRIVLGVAAAGWLVATRAGAQTFPLFPDGAHSSVPPPYTVQGPLPLQQQSRPLVEAGIPVEASRGVPNGVALAPPSLLTRRVAQNEPPRLPPGLSADAFLPSSKFLPDGTKWALSRFLPGRGAEYYLLMPPGAVLPPHEFDCGREITVVEGEAFVGVGSGPPQPAHGAAPVEVPAGVPHELLCGAQKPCLVRVRADGPLHVTWLDSHRRG